jgi:hypothetical protein
MSLDRFVEHIQIKGLNRAYEIGREGNRPPVEDSTDQDHNRRLYTSYICGLEQYLWNHGVELNVLNIDANPQWYRGMDAGRRGEKIVYKETVIEGNDKIETIYDRSTNEDFVEGHKIGTQVREYLQKIAKEKNKHIAQQS